jgi:hypothetical protein
MAKRAKTIDLLRVVDGTARSLRRARRAAQLTMNRSALREARRYLRFTPR